MRRPAFDGGPYTFELDGREVSAKPVLQVIKETVKDYTPQWASSMSDVPARDIARIAREFAKAAPQVCIPCLKRDAAGPNYANSWRLRHAINILQALLGAIDREGGVLLLNGVKIPWLEEVSPPVKDFPSSLLGRTSGSPHLGEITGRTSAPPLRILGMVCMEMWSKPSSS